MGQVQECIAEQMHSPDEEVNACLQVLAERRGKMLRPGLVLLCGKAVKTPLEKEHLDLAVMIELIHMASLLHDDVIDAAQLRRGFASANALWDNTVAVLLGDFLLCRSFSIGAACGLGEAVKLLGRTAQTLCTGELKQNLLKGRWDLTEQDYFCIVEAKTAALFACSGRIGAIAAGASNTQEQALNDYGFHFGMAFQIADDLLDILSTEAQTGKTQGGDLLQEKWTLPVIHWLNQNTSQKQKRIEQWRASGDPLQLTRQMRLDGSIDYAVKQARRQAEQAQQKLSGFAQTPAKDALLSLAGGIISGVGLNAE